MIFAYQITKLQAGTFMNTAFCMKLPYNQQRHFLFERPDNAVATRQGGSFRQTYECTTEKQHYASDTGIKLWNSIEN